MHARRVRGDGQDGGVAEGGVVRGAGKVLGELVIPWKSTSSNSTTKKTFRVAQAHLLDDAQPSFDIWSFGCLVYELLSKRPLFTGMDRSGDSLMLEEERIELRKYLFLIYIHFYSLVYSLTHLLKCLLFVTFPIHCFLDDR